MSFLSNFLTRRFLFAGAMSGFVSLVISVITGSLITMVNPAHAQNQTIAGRYVPMNKGSTIKDTQTGLVWQRCSVGQSWNGRTCEGEAGRFNFDQAQALAKDGWRVPTVRQLASLIYCSSGKTKDKDDPKDGGAPIANWCDGSYDQPTIQTDVFPNTPSDGYWTSSPYVGDSSSAWDVDFYGGGVGYGNRSDGDQVRLVRASQ